MYTVKNIKTFRGMEGSGFSASIYRDGKNVGEVTDDASGGPMQFFWNTRDEEKAAKDFEKNLPEKRYGDFEKLDQYFSELVDDFETQKKFQRISKKKTLFRLHGDNKEEWRTLSKPLTDSRVLPYLHDKYGDKLEAIYGLEKVTK